MTPDTEETNDIQAEFLYNDLLRELELRQLKGEENLSLEELVKERLLDLFDSTVEVHTLTQLNERLLEQALRWEIRAGCEKREREGKEIMYERLERTNEEIAEKSNAILRKIKFVQEKLPEGQYDLNAVITLLNRVGDPNFGNNRKLFGDLIRKKRTSRPKRTTKKKAPAKKK